MKLSNKHFQFLCSPIETPWCLHLCQFCRHLKDKISNNWYIYVQYTSKLYVRENRQNGSLNTTLEQYWMKQLYFLELNKMIRSTLYQDHTPHNRGWVFKTWIGDKNNPYFLIMFIKLIRSTLDPTTPLTTEVEVTKLKEIVGGNWCIVGQWSKSRKTLRAALIQSWERLWELH